jgi:hypothetical protein
MRANTRSDRRGIAGLRRPAAAALATLAAACCLLAPATAAAAAAAQPPAAAAPPTLEVELWPDRQQRLTSLTVMARLPEKAALPATVRLPLPEGATITWSGEIDIADDTGASDTSQTPGIVETAGGRAVDLVARKSRLVQYEAVLGRSVHTGDKVTTVLVWTQTVPTGSVTFSSRVPLEATQVKVTPPPAGDPQKDEQLGQMLYTLAPQDLKPGQRFALQVEYQLASGARPPQGTTPAGGGTMSGPGGIPIWLLVLLVVAVAMLPVLVGVQRRRRAAAGEAPPEDPGDGGSAGDEPDDDPEGDVIAPKGDR